ncbi:hypothetical protein FB45DRAFT_1078921 [Roridomyces roridus]|uniref:SAM domain-containing protein n=1 Tax=Roridomyces roridus TaxID=1738132 RepID=A0AAD7CKX6_9AGAR|nr:hypothetical protein FB45DRAFT_1078921 [Roridomyces roridus]
MANGKKKKAPPTGQRKIAKVQKPPTPTPPRPKPRRKKKEVEEPQEPQPTAVVDITSPSPPRRPKQKRVKLLYTLPPSFAARLDEQPQEPEENEEAAAAAALVAMGGGTRSMTQTAARRRLPSFEEQMDRIFASTVPGATVEELRQARKDDHEEDGIDIVDSNESGSDQLSSDEDDDDEEVAADEIAVQSSPAREAKARKDVVKIRFMVPVGAASRELDVKSNADFAAFMTALSKSMGKPKTLLDEIAYTISWAPKTPKQLPTLLENDTSWKNLLSRVDKKCKGKKGSGKIKEFSITILDTSGGENAGQQKGKKSKDKPSEVEPAPADKATANFYKQLEDKWHCDEHDRPCYFLTDGPHHHLTNQELAKWAWLIERREATVKLLPTELNIADAAPRQRSAQRALARVGTEPETPGWIRELVMPMLGFAMGGMARNNAAMETPVRAAPHPATPGPSRRAASPDTNLLSSGTKRAASSMAPSMPQWLAWLDDDDSRGRRHNLCFSNYSATFKTNGFFDLGDMENASAADLAIMLDAPIGIANRLANKKGSYI